jgi:RimJ/RimL family protein N-acetyltransferase
MPPATFPQAVPVLTDGVIRLRAHRDEDRDAIVEQCADPDMMRFTTVPRPYGPAQAQEFLERVAASWDSPDATAPRYWAIEVPGPDGPRFGGTIDYRPTHAGSAEVGYGLHPGVRGHGHTQRALRLVLAHAFAADRLEWMHWRGAVGNWPSRRAAWACGFRVEGRVRGFLASPDGPLDGWIGSLHRDDPRTPATRWFRPVELSDGALTLRAWHEDDLAAQGGAPDGGRFQGEVVPRGDDQSPWVEERRERMARGEGVYWCVTDTAAPKKGRRVLGGIHLFAMDRPWWAGTGRLGYWLHEEARGRGVMGRSVGLVLEHAFRPWSDGGLGLHRVEAEVDTTNAASARCLLRAGFRPSGLAREAGLYLGIHVTDVVAMELIRGEDRARNAESHHAAIQGPVTVTGERVVLRAFRESDGAAMAAMLRSEDLGPWGLPHADESAALTWLALGRAQRWRGRGLIWAITVDQDPVGFIHVQRLDDPFYRDGGELGYWVSHRARGHGYGTEAVRVLLAHVFAPAERGGLGLRRITGMTSPENVPSQRVLAKAGLTQWAVEPQAVAPRTFGPPRGPHRLRSPDRLKYAATRDEWRAHES